MEARALERRYLALSALRWLPVGLTLPFLTLMPLARGLSLSQVGVVFAVHGAVVLLCELPTGALADAAGRRRTLLAGAVATTAAFALFAVATGLLAFVAAAVLLATGRALISGSLEAWFVDALRAIDPDRPLRGGLAGGLAVDGLALAAGSLLGGAVPLLFDLDARGDRLLVAFSPAFALAVAASAAYVAAVAVVVHDPPRVRPEHPRGLRAEVREVARVAAGEARAHVNVRLILGVAGTIGVVLSAIELLWQPRLAELAGGAAGNTFLFGALNAVAMLAVSAGAALSPLVASRIGAGVAYAGALAAAGAAFAGLALASTEAAFVVAFVAAYGLISLSQPMHYERLHETVGDRARATVLSADSLVMQLGAAGANLGLARLADGAGIPASWGLAAGACLVGAAVASRVVARTS